MKSSEEILMSKVPEEDQEYLATLTPELGAAFGRFLVFLSNTRLVDASTRKAAHKVYMGLSNIQAIQDKA